MFIEEMRLQPSFTTISLFSGCGGLDLGLERAGFKVAFATDIDSACAESYRLNRPQVPFFHGSISELTPKLISEIAGGMDLNGIDLLAGGPPCPPFSKSRFYRKEKPRALDDPLARETLGGYLRLLKSIKPRAFLLENVKGLAYKVHKEALELIISEAESLGYSCSWKVLNAADYGVPQIRERCFVLGAIGCTPDIPLRTHADEGSGEFFSKRLLPHVTAGEAIGDLDTEENASDEGHFAGGKYHDLLKQVPPGDNYLYFTEKRGHPNPQFKWRSRYWSFLLKLSPGKPSWTIQARRSNNMGPLHWRNRILRIEEVKRLQTFPDEWRLAGRLEEQWRQVGNAVPPLLAQRMGEALACALYSLEPTPKEAIAASGCRPGR